MHDFFLIPFCFCRFLKTTFLTICDADKNYFGKTIQDRELKFSPVILWNVLGAMSFLDVIALF